MKKIEEREEVKRVEGYVDNEKRVFVVTADPHNLLTYTEPQKTPEEQEVNYQKVGELLRKYKPNWIK